ncbi:MAG: hypothetical protein H6742_15040 [Alphaproteobacteria bacterium]|nr:hypothetical protein [Alphaproteobacteria bacterium]
MTALISFVVLLAACEEAEPPVEDAGFICARPGDDGTVTIDANSDDCSADHDGAAFSCEAAVDGDTITVHTSQTPGDDPNDGCGGPQRATCAVDVADGAYTLVFAGDEAELTVPVAEELCLPDQGETAE